MTLKGPPEKREMIKAIKLVKIELIINLIALKAHKRLELKKLYQLTITKNYPLF